jgi:pimeloyl-ACP methyl ester carboxylesterase
MRKDLFMSVPTSRKFTPAQIVALALIVMAMAGLAYLRFAPETGSVSVPAGANAGNLFLKPCDYATESGTYAADCGTLVVPENRANPQSRLLALPVTRIRARFEQPAEPVFRLEGGPGKTNMEFPMASRFAEDRDVVLVGYRGADGSVRLDCPEVESALKHSTDLLGENSLSRYGAAFGSCANRLTNEGVDLAGYSLTARVDDLEAARKALGYNRIDLLSESAGTRYAMVYSWRYPKSIHRSVMLATNPPGHFLWDAKTTDEQIRRYADLCAKDAACSARTDDLATAMRRTNRDIPERWGFLPIKEGNVRVATFFGLVESTSKAAPISAPMTLDSWLSAAAGDASGFWFQSLLADLAFPQSFIWGEMAALGNADARAAHRFYSSSDRETDTILGSPGTDFIWGGGNLASAWPAHPDDATYDHVQTSTVETLIIGGQLDFATPPQAATRELLPYLPNSHQVVLPQLGHSTSFWTEQPETGTRLINTFLDSGRIDDSLYQPISVDFTPEVTQTALAKGIAGTMIGLALLTVLSLLAMARRVHKRGGFGAKARATLRSLYSIVLGLGGWFAGALLVMTTMPGVPLDDELLATISVGLPTGLGIYLAWINRNRSAKTKTTGFAAAIGGALLGAWLGFNATEGLAALLTAIVGAAVAANLLLLILDVSDRQVRNHVSRPTQGNDAEDVAVDPSKRPERTGASVA